MLEKCGGAQNLPVTIRHIHGFARMRKYKPYRAVVNALKKSAFLDVVDDKYVKRKVPLLASALEDDSDDEGGRERGVKDVEPKKTVAPQPVVPDQPWMTKGMVCASILWSGPLLRRIAAQTDRIRGVLDRSAGHAGSLRRGEKNL